MSDIIDIVAKLTYELNDKALNNAIVKLKEQAAGIEVLKKKAVELKQALSTTENTQQQKSFQTSLDKTAEKIDKQTAALKRNFDGNKQLQTALREEIGIVEQLTQYIKRATEERETLTDPAEVKRYTQEIHNAQIELRGLLTVEKIEPPKGRILALQEELRLLKQRNSTLVNPVDIARGNQAEVALQKQISNLQKLGTTAKQTGGIINGINADIARLGQKKLLATTEAEIITINKEITSLQGRIKTLNNAGIVNPSAGRGVLSGLGSSVLQGVGIGAGFGLVTQGVSAISSFIAYSSELGAQLEGVERAFDRLNQPGLLANLREGTRGTVSDLELMKKAVQFNNFGLPLEKLASSLEFARRRAKDTGDDINYITESLVNGIARQSPRILDNLGINAKRVSEEFKRTGDFAEAAFKIIQQESAKAGEDLETFAEKQARFNAQIENQQARLGQFFNESKGLLFTFLEDLTLGAEGNSLILSRLYLQQQEDLKRSKKEEQLINKTANDIFLKNFQQFTVDYTSKDAEGRKKVEQQANNMYENLANSEQAAFAKSLGLNDQFLKSLDRAYGQLNKTFTSRKINLNTLTESEIRNATKEELTAIQETISNSRNSLTATDTATINRFNRLEKVVKETLSIISGENQKAQNKELEEWKEYLRKKEEALKDATLIFKRLTREAIEAAKTEGIIDAGLADKTGAQNDIFQSLLPSFIKETQSGFDSRNNLGELPVGVRPEQRNAQLEIDADIKRRKKEIKEERAKELEEWSNYYSQLTGYALNAFSLINQAQINSLDLEIRAREKRVDAAISLAERGNVAALKIEQERLEETIRQREIAGRREVQLNAALQLSYALLAVAQVAASPVSAATGGLAAAPLIAALLGVLASGYALAQSIQPPEPFWSGGYVGDGGKYEPKGVVHGGEYVINKEQTAKHYDVLQAINAGLMPNLKSPQLVNNFATKIEMQGVEKKLDSVIEAIEMNKVTQTVKFDQHGLYIGQENYKRNEQNRFSG